ncbi:hypothetical protein D6D19_07212 [Aureobasidium pullulans]|uniref:Uncharacterized protein n=1 Tax=Aureobasidium pullulans TaxID=5580 RepID=A0A4S9KP07_AURPU|nr:hypothetical protein D6D19_07212 [Aureobasidium pullulans]THY17662.1 hypothetical protein D6D00_08423 [Aureobasidium pullulans]
MGLPDQMLLLEPLHCTADEIMQQGARNPTAVQRYLDCLSRGWIGQALIERYTYGESPDTPQGMLQTNGIIDGKFVEWLKPVKDEIKDDLREILEGGYEDMIAVERDIYEKAMEDSNDPGKELLSELVEMIDKGLQSMPKILVTITSEGQETASPIELKWSYGLEDAITRLSTKVLEKDIVGMDIKKSGRDFHILYQVDDAAEDSVILALVEEMREWR